MHQLCRLPAAIVPLGCVGATQTDKDGPPNASRSSLPRTRRAWVTSGVIRYCYRVAGDAHVERLPLVLVHGLSVSSAYWTHLQPLLATHRPVYAPDLPGFGRTTRRAGSSIRPHSHGTGRLDECRWSHAGASSGHSLGGPVVAEFAHHYPERAARLILVGATIGTRGASAPIRHSGSYATASANPRFSRSSCGITGVRASAA
jgi:pimeloyl-ACP methyl ester carboxylesterase